MSDFYYKGTDINNNFMLIWDTFTGSEILPCDKPSSESAYYYNYKLKFEDDKTFYYLKYMVRYESRLTFSGVVINKGSALCFLNQEILM